jgi:hypothetical protein
MTFAAVAVGVFVVAFGPVSDGDIYWHLAAGREMVRRHALLRADPFTLSAAGRPWVDVHWLFQLGAYAVHRVAGLVGLTAVKAALVAAGAVGATRVAEEVGGARARAACAVALLGLVFLARHLLPIRPVIVTLLFLTLFFAVLEQARLAWESRAVAPRRMLWLLPLAQVLWTNCQGLSALGPALVGAYLLAHLVDVARAPRTRRLRDLETIAATLVLCLLAGLVTPYGLAGARLPLRLFLRLVPGTANVFSAAVAENVPPFLLERTAPEQVGPFRWVLAGMALTLVLSRSRLRLAHGLVLAAFAGLALMANRNVLLLYWMAAPILAITIGGEGGGVRARAAPWPARPGPRLWVDRLHLPRLLRLGAPALLLAELGLVGWAAAREAPPGSPTPFHFPVESVRRLAAAGVTGPVFAPDQHGGYVELMLPGATPYIDTRLVLHTGAEYAEYLSLFAEPRAFDSLDAKVARVAKMAKVAKTASVGPAAGFSAVILTTAYPDSYLGLIAHLAADPSFRLVYTDGYEVLFTRSSRGAALPGIRLSERSTVDAVGAELEARFGARPEILAAARLNLARLLVVLGEHVGAERVLMALDARPAVELRARAELAAGELGAAESLGRILVDADARDVHGLTLLGEIAAARGQPTRAADWLRRSLAVDPYDPETRALVARLQPSAVLGD